MVNNATQKHFFWDRSALSILVEEEGRVRRYWREFFEKQGAALRVYDSHELFLRDLETIKGLGKRIQFFFDQEMGKWRGVGTELARAVQMLPCRMSTALVTAHYPAFFSHELRTGLLDQVFGKYPEEIFGPDFYRSRVHKEMRESSDDVVVSDDPEGSEKDGNELVTSFILRQDYKLDPAYLPAEKPSIKSPCEKIKVEEPKIQPKSWISKVKELLLPHFELPPKEFRHLEELKDRHAPIFIGNRYY